VQTAAASINAATDTVTAAVAPTEALGHTTASVGTQATDELGSVIQHVGVTPSPVVDATVLVPDPAAGVVSQVLNPAMPTPADLAQPLPTVGGPLDDPTQVVAQVGQAVTDSPMPAAALTDAFSASPSGLLDHTSLVDVLGNAPALDATASPAVGLVDPSSPVGAALSSDSPRFGLSMDDVLNALAGKAMSSGMLATLLALMSLTLTRAGRLTETVAGVATGVQIWFTNIRLLPCTPERLVARRREPRERVPAQHRRR
jgi:hypothetical protein